jgi:hypothetical protein
MIFGKISEKEKIPANIFTSCQFFGYSGNFFAEGSK